MICRIVFVFATVSSSELPQIKELMGSDLKHVSTWLVVNKLSLNVLKSEFMIIGPRQRMASLEGNVDLSVGGYSLKKVQKTKCLGVHTDENLSCSEQVNHISKKVVLNINVLRKIAPTLTLDNRITVYRLIIEP